MTMNKSKEKYEPEMNFRAANPTKGTHPITRAGCSVSELLEDSGNCRQIINQELSLHLLSDSLFREQLKLRHALDWAHSFLSNDSEVHHQFCRAESLMLVSDEQKDTQRKSPVPAAKCHRPVSCTAGGKEVFGGGGSTEKAWQLEPSNYENRSNNYLCACKPSFSDDPCTPFSFRDEITWPDATNNNNCRTSSLHPCTSDGDTNTTLASDGETGAITESTSCWGKESMMFDTVSNLKLNYGVQSERDKSLQMELRKVKVGKVGTEREVWGMGEKRERREVNEDQDSEKPERTQEMEKTSSISFSCHLKILPSLTVYEQYQLCVDHLRIRQSQHIEPGCFVASKERKTSEEMAAPPPAFGFELNSSITNPEVKTHFNKSVTAAEITEERSSDVIKENQDRSQHNRGRALTEKGQTKHYDNLTPVDSCAKSRPVCQRNKITRNTYLEHDSNKCGELINGTARNRTSADKLINMRMERLRTAAGDHGPAVVETAAITPNPALFPKTIRCHPGVKGRQSRVKGQKKKPGGQGASLRPCEKTSLTDEEILQRAQSSAEIKHTKSYTPEGRGKPTSAHRDTHNFQTQTPLHDDPGSASSTSGAHQCEQTDCKYSPAGVPVCDSWLCLPDEVWMSILSLLPHSDLCRVLQVCSHLNSLATDHTLWRDLRIENSTLTEQWLLCVSRRRPRSLSLYSCSATSLMVCGLEMFLTLCGKNLEELKVISCIGPGLHGDQMLPLIGQLCDHLTSVDVSWSGATDKGVGALSDCCTGLQLKSVVLNGCHVTDDPLIKLIRRHKESLCRLEVFGCQFLTPSCMQTVYEMCPGLKHLNIGQVPKVTAHSLTVMTSYLKCLMSVNLTGLQAVTDATVDTLLQKCVKLQSLTLSSCPRVTDLTLRSISKYTPYIRSLDVSGCTAVSDVGIQSLALGCRRLQELDLSSTRTGNRGVALLANNCSGHLYTVKLSFCHITAENILNLCRRCKRLTVLHLYGCTHLPTERRIREVNTAVKVYPLS